MLAATAAGANAKGPGQANHPGAEASLVGLPVASLTGLAGNLVGPTPVGANPVDALASGARIAAGIGLSAIESGMLDGAKGALQETARVISRTTAPRLRATWFSSTYWRVAGLAAVLTLPFLFAAAVQALIRSDPALLARSALGYLPMAMIGVSIAAPIAMLLLAVTDEMCSVIAGAGAAGGAHFLSQTAVEIAGLSLAGSPFLGFAIGLLTLVAALALALEMLIREAAVYVVVLMLPLAFAGLVWPARRIWAVRLVELLIALILSKFVIVAVLSLAGAAYGASDVPSVTRLLTAMALVMLSTFAPWVMLRLLPFTELAAGAAGAIRAEAPRLGAIPVRALATADGPAAWLARSLRSDADGGDEPGRARTTEDAQKGARDESGVPSSARTEARPGGATSGPSTGASTPVGESGAETGTGSPGTSQADEPAASPTEPHVTSTVRLPGAEARWQLPDNTCRPLLLGPGGSGGTMTSGHPTAEPAGPGQSSSAVEPRSSGDDDLPRLRAQREDEGLL